MSSTETMRKVTISLPQALVDYADQRAKAMNTSRSQVISLALAAVRNRTTEQLAAEGYQFYAAESNDFADASQQAVAESWADIWLATPIEGQASVGPAR
jgi:metal-responsive CopG/Arc/MetJ family transcriptional regulator